MKEKQKYVLPSRARLWLLRGILVFIVPGALLVIAELGLRMLDIGYPTQYWLQKSPHTYISNQKFAWRFFDPQVARAPENVVIEHPKPHQTYRIYVFGGSAANGVPQPAFNFGRILKVMLEHRYKGINFEVINVAITAINSYVVLPIARDCADKGADLFIIYLGNNEIVGPFGPGSVWGGGIANLSLIRASLRLRTMRLGQLFERTVVKWLTNKQTGDSSWQGMTQFMQHHITLDDPTLKRAYVDFRTNLDDICAVGRERHIPIALCTVAVNLANCAPFASEHRKGLPADRLRQWQILYDKGQSLFKDGAYSDALDTFQAAADIDGSFAGLWFLIGQCQTQLGQNDAALQAYRKARDLDALRFRADATINNIIRQTAERQQNGAVNLVDVERIFDDAYHNAPDRDLFYEHVHLTFAGNYLVASSLFKQIEPRLPGWVTEQRDASVITSIDSCANALALTPYFRAQMFKEMLDLMSNPPFTDQMDHINRRRQEMDQFKTLQKESTSQASIVRTRQLLEARVNQFPHDIYFRKLLMGVLESQGDFAAENSQITQLLATFPDDIQLLKGYGKILCNLKRIPEGIAQYRHMLSIAPELSLPYIQMGEALGLENKPVEAGNMFQKALDRDPASLAARINLGDLLYATGHLEEARKVFEKGLEFAHQAGNEEFEGVYLNRIGGILTAQHNPYQAIQHYQKARTVFETYGFPLHLGAVLNNLGDIYVQQHDLANAQKAYQAALDISQDYDDLLGSARSLSAIGNVYFLNNDYDDAVSALEKVLGIYEHLKSPEQTDILTQLGNAYLSRGAIDTALVYHQKALTLSETFNDKQAKATALSNLGICYAKLNQPEQARKMFGQAEQLYQELRDINDLRRVEAWLQRL